MEPEWLDVLLLWAGCVVVAFTLRRAALWRAAGGLLRGLEDSLHRGVVAPPPGRPFEAVVRDARRLGGRYHHPAPGVAFAKAEGIRQAYDKVLAECCRALDIAHLLQTLPPGGELDHERRRVEHLLADAGLWINDAAA